MIFGLQCDSGKVQIILTSGEQEEIISKKSIKIASLSKTNKQTNKPLKEVILILSSISCH